MKWSLNFEPFCISCDYLLKPVCRGTSSKSCSHKLNTAATVRQQNKYTIKFTTQITLKQTTNHNFIIMTGRQVLRKSIASSLVSHFIRGVVFTPSSIDVHGWYFIGSYLLPVQGKGGVGGGAGGFQERSNSLRERKNAETQRVEPPKPGLSPRLLHSFLPADCFFLLWRICWWTFSSFSPACCWNPWVYPHTLDFSHDLNFPFRHVSLARLIWQWPSKSFKSR